MSNILLTTLDILYYALIVLIFARIILSWVNIGSYEIRDMIFRLTEPLLAPIRRILPATAGLDLSPMILLILASILFDLLRNVLR
jgi:YggT family protein